MATLFATESHIDRSAEVSDCERYRWWLRRSWSLWDEQGLPIIGKGVCCFVMLNPSTADALRDDPTIRRCISFARAWGYNILSVRNLFPWRATDPRELRVNGILTVSGRERGDMELLAACTADLVVAAWGAKPFGRDVQALRMWREAFPAKPIYCLGTTKDGHPKHPLYVKGDAQPVLFKAPAPPAPTDQGE